MSLHVFHAIPAEFNNPFFARIYFVLCTGGYPHHGHLRPSPHPQRPVRALLIFFCLGLMALVPAYFLKAMPSQETESQLKAIRSQRP